MTSGPVSVPAATRKAKVFQGYGRDGGAMGFCTRGPGGSCGRREGERPPGAAPGEKSRVRPDRGSVAEHEEVAGVLGEDLAVAADRRRGVGGAQGELLEEVVADGASLEDGICVAVLAVDEDSAVTGDRHHVDAELEAVRVIADAAHVPAGVAGA